MSFISPDEMMAAARKFMLNNREPVSEDDWVRVVEFIAYNTPIEVAIPVVHIMAVLYEIPLKEETLTAIATYQSLARVLLDTESEHGKRWN